MCGDLVWESGVVRFSLDDMLPGTFPFENFKSSILKHTPPLYPIMSNSFNLKMQELFGMKTIEEQEEFDKEVLNTSYQDLKDDDEL